MSGIEGERLAVVTPLRRSPRADAQAGRERSGAPQPPIEAAVAEGDPRPIGTVVEELRERMLAVQRHPSGRYAGFGQAELPGEAAEAPAPAEALLQEPAPLATVTGIGGERFEEESITDPEQIHAIALRALARRDHSERELHAALTARAVPAVLAEVEIERLLAARLLDDERLAVDLVERLGTRKRLSRAAMIQELKRRMLPAESINRAVSAVDAEVELAQATAFAETKRAALSGLDREVAERRLRGQLQRRGYGGETITKAIQAVRSPLQQGVRRPGGVRFEP